MQGMIRETITGIEWCVCQGIRPRLLSIVSFKEVQQMLFMCDGGNITYCITAKLTLGSFLWCHLFQILVEVFNSEKRDNTTIYIDLEARVMGKKVYLYNHTSLCNVDSVAYWGDRNEGDDVYSNALLNACPIQNGMFGLFFNFQVPETSRDASLELTPDIRVRFYDVSRNKIGCVESGDLAKYAFSREMEQKGQRFFVFSILLFCGLFAFCMIGHQRRQRREERKAVKKQASRMRRFHYIQTSRSGEVQMTTSPSIQPSFSYESGSSRGARGVARAPPTILESHDESSASGGILSDNTLT